MSKSSSSTSNSSIPTSPAETSLIPEDISPMDGLEDINIQPFLGIANMRGIVRRQCDKLQNGGSDQQYLLFTRVSVDDLAKIECARSSIGKCTRMTHYTDIDLLIVKLTSVLHEMAHRNFAKRVVIAVARMGTPGLAEDEFCGIGAGRLHGRRSSKEGDSAYKPESFRPNDADWPTIVIEAGVSESLRRLRFDASWWLMESGGDVKIVILILIQRAQNAQSWLQIEKWEHAPSRRLLPLGPPHNKNNLIRQLPTKVQEITIVSNAPLPVTGGPFTVTGAPLVLEFDKIFLRPAVLPETDITFDVQELSDWAANLV